jgi:tRNA A-37 threonylcarbamoyl transferase component Bud32
MALTNAHNMTANVVQVESAFETYINLSNGVKFSAYVMELGDQTTSPSLDHLLSELHALHMAKITHGDARGPNLVRFGDKWKWIDIMQAAVDDLRDAVQNDVRILYKFVFKKHLPESSLQLLESYTNDHTLGKLQTIFGVHKN